MELIEAKKFFYTSVINGKQVGLLAGPFDTHQQALDVVDGARAMAEEADPFAAFYSFGTLSLRNGKRLGIFNEALGIVRSA